MSDWASPNPPKVMAFGPFQLFPARHLLLEAGKPVRLGSRALSILTVLVDRAGEVVSKDELVAQVWPQTFVEEGTLRVHIAALRRALGDGQSGNRYLATVPGRGYCFVGPVSLSDAAQTPSPNDGGPTYNLPVPLTRMVGRSKSVRELVARLPGQRFITIVGPGGIGKTTVALAVADALAVEYKDGIRFVDLATLVDPTLVPSSLAAVLGVAALSGDPIAGLTDFLKDKRMMLVLDSCEHVIEAAAILAEKICKATSAVDILATSREPLRAEGEHLMRLGPLDLPPPSSGISAADAIKFSAVELFVERATAILNTFELTDANAPIVSDICIRLDGMALAIELAAGRVDAFGIQGLAEHLGDRFRILTGGRRTVLARHRTLAATLDWSYELLPEAERIILRRLAVFSGGVTLEGACVVVADPEIPPAAVVDGLANLVAKSLVSADIGTAKVLYRLLDTTRAYSLGKLGSSGERECISRRHAEYIKALFERAEWQMLPTDEWMAAYGSQIGDLRAALDWALSSGGDPAIAVGLTVAAVPLWFQLSLIDECRDRVERALALSESVSSRSKRQEMQLHAALGWSLMYTPVPVRETGGAWTAALELARDLDDVDYQLRSLWGLWAGSMNNGQFGNAHRLALEFRRLADKMPDPADQHIADRMIGASLHFLGDQAGARRHVEHMLAHYAPPAYGAHIVRFQFDQRVTANITLARVLWLQGFVHQATETIERDIASALSTGHRLSLCNALVQAACPVALLAKELARAERYIALLAENTATHGVDIWRVYRCGFEGQVLVYRGDFANGLPRLRTAINELHRAKFVQYQTAFLATLAEGLTEGRQVSQALAVINEMLAQSEVNEERWCLPELLRIKGQAVLLEGAHNASIGAEGYFLRSIDVARQQSALSWELRTTMSLSRLLIAQARRSEARDRLASVYGRFSEGFETPALKATELLLEELR
jgi:predicted ATPase/DNA-binding winged helix-turn-helix (wHTH) protein